MIAVRMGGKLVSGCALFAPDFQIVGLAQFRYHLPRSSPFRSLQSESIDRMIHAHELNRTEAVP